MFAEEEFKGVDIYDAIQDHYNNYWFATDRGVIMHDGYRFTTVTSPDMKSASAFGFVKDSQGTIYFFNLHHQIFRIKNEHIDLFYEIPEEMRYHEIDLAVDTKDHLIIQARGLVRISPDGQSVKVITKATFDGTNGPIIMQQLKDGSTISVSFKGEIFKQRFGKQLPHKKIFLEGIPEGDYSSIYNWFTIHDKIYGIDRQSMRVYQYHPESESFTYQTTFNTNLSTGTIWVYTTKDRIWLSGTSNGIYVFDANLKPLYDGERIYKNHFISDILTDHEGNILLNTFDEGVMVIPDPNIQAFSFDFNEKTSRISSSNDQVFISTNKGNVYQFNQGKPQLIFSDPLAKDIDAMDCWTAQQLLYLSCGDGLKILQIGEGQPKEKMHFKGSFKRGYFEEDSTFLLAYNFGIVDYKLQPNGKLLEVKRVLKKRAYCVSRNSESKTIYGGISDGLTLVYKDGRTDVVTINDTIVYPNDIINDNNTIYIGTRKHGILVYTNDKLAYTIDIDSRIRKMQLYDNQLYILTVDGLIVTDLKGKHVRKLNKSSGLLYDQIAQFHIANGYLYITNSESIEFISLDKLASTSKVIPLRLSSVMVNNQAFDNKELNADQKNLHFTFNANSIRYRENIEYHYRLLGLDEQWQTLPYDENELIFNALPSGNYTLEVYSVNEGLKSAPVRFDFSIAAPFHQRWWFYLLIIILSGLVIALIFLSRIRYIRKKNIEKLEKQRIQTDLLETELKALRSQMNPHFIFNSLNSIQELILKEDTDASYDYIVLFADLVRSTLNYSNKDFIPIEDELEFLNVYLSLEKLRFKDDFTYSIEYDGEEEIKLPSLLVQPFIENALLHGLLHKQGEKKLSIRFEFNGELKCIIEDNGIGRKKSSEIGERQGRKHESFALEAITKRLQIFNERDAESVGHYEISDLYPDQEETGTRIVIYLPYRPNY